MRLTEAVRAVASFAPLVGLAPRPEPRPEGISALVRVRGDEEWIEPSLSSLERFADEILVLDNGAAPGTRAAIERAAQALGARLTVERCPEHDLVALSNLGLARARHRFIIRWDADFVGHTSGPGDLAALRRHLLGLDPRRSWLVYVTAAELAGDLEHQFPDRRIRMDGQVHTASARARYVRVEREPRVATLAAPDRVLREGATLPLALESLRVPRDYRILQWRTVAYFHVHVKGDVHLLRRHFWLEWLRRGDPARHPTLDAYALEQVRARWGFESLEAAAPAFVARWCEGLVPFDAAVCGPYPELLAPHLARRRYRVDYRDGRIVGRSQGC